MKPKKPKSRSKPAPATSAPPDAGEPRGKAAVAWKLPIYSGIKSCSGATGIPEAVLRIAKAAGSQAFRHSKVDLGLLLPDLFKDWTKYSTPGAESPRSELDIWKAKREKLRWEKDTGALVLRSEAAQAWHAAEAELFAAIDRVLCNELPPAVVGLTELEIAARCKARIGECKARIRERLSKWLEEQEGK